MSQHWNSPLELRAMSLGLPEVDNHPNRHSFSGVLAHVDRPSDGSPYGSEGRRIVLTRAAAENALGSLLGMGVNVAVGMNGHAAQAKIGVLTSAYIEGSELRVAGHLFSSDFKQQVNEIKAEQHRLGMSFECRDITVRDPDGDPLYITACCFTGASILRKVMASYVTTSIAAAAQDANPVTVLLAQMQAHADATNTSIERMNRELDNLRRRLGV
jgi:hypothetical protein